MKRETIVQFVIGCLALAFIWFVLLPLLTGVVHTWAVVIVVIVAILWIANLGGLFK